MTALRPEYDAGHGEAREGPGAFEAAVEGLADPLNDPLPQQQGSPWFRTGQAAVPQQPEQGTGPGQGSGPVPPPGPDPVRASAPKHAAPPAGATAPPPVPEAVRAEPSVRGAQEALEVQDPASGWSDDYYNQYVREPLTNPVGISGPAQAAPAEASAPAPAPRPAPEAATTLLPVVEPEPVAAAPLLDNETVALRTADLPAAPEREQPPTGGRAERRKAARGGGRARKRQEPQPTAEPGQGGLQDGGPAKPLSRVEARRAARALKDSPGVVISRVVGEMFITFGVLMLLFVTYQLWWTNIRADQYAGNETSKIQNGWAKGSGSKGPQAGAFQPGQGFAIMHIPKLDVVVPIAEGISKAKVLDHGMVGHYSEGKLKTAMPSDKLGNFAVAGHRNTHGEPFRYINQLQPGDEVVVETQDAYYTYDMTRTLPSTSPSNVSVIDPVPAGSGFTAPGRYITLTTCTPEFTSTYRLIVWGKMVDEQPRSEGLPKALVR